MPAEQVVIVREVPKIERKLEIIIIHESLWESLLSDLGTFVAVTGIGVVGWFLNSSALTWVALLMFFVMAVFRTTTKKTGRLSVEQARDRLDQLEQEFLKNRPAPTMPKPTPISHCLGCGLPIQKCRCGEVTSK